MKDTATISIERLDKYRDMEKALKSYKENGAFMIETIDDYSYSIHTSKTVYVDCTRKVVDGFMAEKIKELKDSESDLLESIKNRDNESYEIEQELRKEVDRLTIDNQILKESKIPIEIGKWSLFILIGCVIGFILSFLIFEGWS